MPQPTAILDALREASQGMLFLSETEAELTPFEWGREVVVDEDEILRNPERTHPKGTPVETTTLERFFRAVSPEDRPKFDRLATVLRGNLSNLAVYKVGAIVKDVYVIGKARDGRWTGLMTSVVET